MKFEAPPKKAFLLAAGLGTRLGALTRDTPKCLISIGGQPLLHWWLKILEVLKVSDVLINTHHLAPKVEAFLRAHRYNLTVHPVHELELLGSGGTLAVNRSFVKDDQNFWIFYADTLITDDLAKLWRLHRDRESGLTMGLFRAPDPRAAGIVELDGAGRVLSFEEKPSRPVSNLAAAGAYLATHAVFKALPWSERARGCDLGRDVVPKMIDKAHGVELSGVIDIGTPGMYDKARREWDHLGLERRLAAPGNWGRL